MNFFSTQERKKASMYHEDELSLNSGEENKRHQYNNMIFTYLLNSIFLQVISTE